MHLLDYTARGGVYRRFKILRFLLLAYVDRVSWRGVGGSSLRLDEFFFELLLERKLVCRNMVFSIFSC